MPTKKLKFTSKTIRSVAGRRLILTPTRLRQLECTSSIPWYTKAEDFLQALQSKSGYIRIRECGSKATLMVVFFEANSATREVQIGCELFDKKTFALIRRTFKAASRV